MKLSCEIVQDLLPLYEESLCCNESRQAVEEHLSQCPHCAGMTRKLKIAEITPNNAEKAVKRSFYKVRRRWIASILLVLILLPLLGTVGYLSWNEYQKEGICFSNLDEISTAREFANLLVDGKYDRVAKFMEYADDYQSIQDALSDTLEDNLPWVEAVQIGDERFMVSRDIAANARSMNVADFWRWLLTQYNGLFWIPAEAFSEIAEGLGSWEGDVWYSESGTYTRIETQWGSYVTGLEDWMLRQQSHKNDPVTLCYSLWVYPEMLYTENQSAIMDYAQSCWQSSQDWNKPYANMTLEEYAQHCKQKFVTDMQNLGVTIRYKGVEDAYWLDGWVIAVELQFTKNGETALLRLDLRVRGDVVEISGGHHQPDSPAWINDVWNCL